MHELPRQNKGKGYQHPSINSTTNKYVLLDHLLPFMSRFMACVRSPLISNELMYGRTRS